ncbi:MAG: PD-(D/E)XK nuclease family protein [Magnetococcus sp. YQC-3]
MSRPENLFLYRVIKDENSATEMLCNLMAFSPFRQKFLKLLQLSDETIACIAYQHFSTQVDTGTYGRPDMEIRNKSVHLLIEVKLNPWTNLTGNQPKGYLQFLSDKADINKERCLIFLLPPSYQHRNIIETCIKEFKPEQNKIKVVFIEWNEVITAIEQQGRNALIYLFGEFVKSLRHYVAPTQITFQHMEISKMFDTNTPSALMKLIDVVKGVTQRSGYKTSAYKEKDFSEYGVYFKNRDGDSVLWFGIWPGFWMKNGKPLCFGVDKKWDDNLVDIFENKYEKKVEFENYVCSWIEEEELKSDSVKNIIDKLTPYLDNVNAERK